MMTQLKATVPSRIAIDLYDMHGGLGRIDGSMGFSIEYPCLVFNASINPDIEIVNSQILDLELLSSLESSLNFIKEKMGFGGIKIELRECIPVHSGFGSKTATLLSTAYVYSRLYGGELDHRELGVLLRRGGTSGLGINLIDKGGFLIEAGHSTKIKNEFAPSSRTVNIYPSPVIARYDVPDWEILLVLPNFNSVHGRNENDFFKKVCPLPENEVGKLARIRLSQVLPAILESDLETFCDGINRIQETMWKRSEISIYGTKVKEIMEYLLSNGALGVGMSSIGPCIYAFGNDLVSLSDSVQSDTDRQYRFVGLTRPNNFGMALEEIE
ncbi:MAG: beta-ribofuranosylaminobenzene 5'-phosphate synthase family protein [archaeon]